MFFFGIFGVQDKMVEVKQFTNDAELLESYRYFHFFFIPLYKWNRVLYVRQLSNQRLYRVPEDYSQIIREERQVDFDRLEEIDTYGDYYGFGDYYERQVKCTKCGQPVNGHYSYCPHCGNKL